MLKSRLMLVVLALAVTGALFFFREGNPGTDPQSPQHPPQDTTAVVQPDAPHTDDSAEPDAARPWLQRWASARHEETRHFQCRQDCRSISDAEIDAVVRTGSLHESDPGNMHKGVRSPKYVVRGKTKAGRELEVVLALPENENTVVLITTYATQGQDPCQTKCKF